MASHRGLTPGSAVTLLDAFLPEFDITEIHRADIRADAPTVFAAIQSVTTAELPLFQLLMGIRLLPARLAGVRVDPVAPPGPLVDWVDELGVVLDQRPDRELVFGIAGKFWGLRGAVLARVPDAEAFRGFNSPGFCRAATNFLLQSGPNGSTRLTTETRIQALGDEARRKFRLYWSIIYPGSSLIRMEWLRAIKRRAENDSSHLSQ